jgi:hypothetical protein
MSSLFVPNLEKKNTQIDVCDLAEIDCAQTGNVSNFIVVYVKVNKYGCKVVLS